MKTFSLGLIVITLNGAAFAAAAHPLQTVFVWALGKNIGDMAKVELDIQEELIKHGVAGERSSKRFPLGMTDAPDAVLTAIASTGCEAVLAVRRTSAIHLESSADAITSLREFLDQRGELLNPQDSLVANSAAPILVTNVTGNGDWQVVQGEGLVFDVKTGKLIWRGSTQIKTAKDLPQAKYLQFVAEKVVHELETAGLVGSVKKS